MTYKSLFYVLMMFATGTAEAFTGPSTGGGGFMLSCPETPVSAKTMEFFDLYEGRESLGFKMALASGDLKEDYFTGVDRTYTLQGYPDLAENTRSAIMANLTRFMQSAKFVSTSGEMPQVNDLGAMPWIPSQCRMSQVAYFDDQTTTIYILKPLWDLLDSLSQAALVHHELWFRELRKRGDLTSENARRAVAHAFSFSGPVPLNDGLPPDADLFWATKGYFGDTLSSSEISTFYAVNFLGGITRLQFTQVGGVAQLAKTWADFPAMTWEFKMGRSPEDPNLVACILETKGLDGQYEAPMNGTMAKRNSVRLRIKTGEPVKMTIMSDGLPRSQAYVTGGTGCSGVLQ